MSVCCLSQLLESLSHACAYPGRRTWGLDPEDRARRSRVCAPQARCVRYSHQRCGYFCGLYPQVSSVQLLFEFGVLLPDPDDLSRRRSLCPFCDGPQYHPLHAPALCQLIAAASALPRRAGAPTESPWPIGWPRSAIAVLSWCHLCSKEADTAAAPCLQSAISQEISRFYIMVAITTLSPPQRRALSYGGTGCHQQRHGLPAVVLCRKNTGLSRL